jgi:superfamily I DNA and/or RNA helicase
MALRLLHQDDNSAVAVTLYGGDIQLTPISPSLDPETSILRSLRTKNSRLVRMLDTTYRLNYPEVQMTSDIFYQGNLQAPQEVMDRRLVVNDGNDSSSGGSSLHCLPSQKLREAINPENPLAYIGVSGNEIEHGLSYDNYAQAMTVSDLCTEFISLGIYPSRISVIAPYNPHVKTIRTLLNGTGIVCNTVHKMLGAENDIVIFATTRSNPSRDLGFIIQPELLNVATSRQLMKLVIVGDAKETFSEGSDTSKKIYDFIESKDSMIILAN